MELTDEEIEIVTNLGFDIKVAETVKEITGGLELETFEKTVEDDYNNKKVSTGLYVETARGDLVYALREKLAGSGYIAYITERVRYSNIKGIAVTKAADIYEVIDLNQTNGINYDFTTDDVIDKLKEWESKCKFTVIGVDFDSLDIDFQTLPADLDNFAEEIYRFCPDTIEQNYLGPPLSEDADWEELGDAIENQTPVDIANFLKEFQQIFLWWD